MRTALADMGHLQPPTPVEKYNTAASSIVNGTERQKISCAIDMIFYWVRDITQQSYFHILWEEGKKNLADYVTKHHPIWHHISMRPIFFKAKKRYRNSKDRKTGIRRGCAGTKNPRGTRKPDNPLKQIRNPIPQDPDNPLKGIQNIVQKQNPQPLAERVNHTNPGLTIPTYSIHKFL